MSSNALAGGLEGALERRQHPLALKRFGVFFQIFFKKDFETFCHQLEQDADLATSPPMPPKKTQKKASKGRNDDLDGMPIVLPEDRIKHLESQTKALEVQLAYRSETTAINLRECENLREELADATRKHEGEKRTSLDVSRSMARQYKGMQEDLLNKINDRERLIEALKDEVSTLKATHAEQIAQKDSVIREKEAHAEKQLADSESMCKQFANMLVDARLNIAKCTHSSA